MSAAQAASCEQLCLLRPISSSPTLVCRASDVIPSRCTIINCLFIRQVRAQAAPTCRKKRLFATQSLTDLLRKEGVDAASLTQDAQGNPSQLSSLLGLEVFDDVEYDSRRPEEWAPPAGQADAPPSPAQVLVVDQEGRGSWELAKVLAWDPNTAEYRAQLDSERVLFASCHEGTSVWSLIYYEPACILPNFLCCLIRTVLGCSHGNAMLTSGERLIYDLLVPVSGHAEHAWDWLSQNSAAS